jgi:predicted O-linked N-acetylglucosamine transferase (SPINDLY family)
VPLKKILMNRELLEKANNLRRSNQNKLADEIYDQLLKIETKNDELIFNKALNITNTDPKKAISLFERVLEINPNVNAVFGNLATIAVDNNLFELVLPIFNKGINANPNNLDLVYQRATLIGNQGNYKKALIDFYKVIDNSTLANNPELFQQHQISKDIEISKVHLRFETQDKNYTSPIPNEDEIRNIKIKEYEYTIPENNTDSKNYFIDFGKHMGLSIKEILDNQPDYLIWCILNLHSFCVSEDIIEILKNKGLNVKQAENINIFKLKLSREEIPTIEFNGEAPDSFTMDEDGNIIY